MALPKKRFYITFLLLVFADSLVTFYDFAVGQIAIRTAILLVLAIYYRRQTSPRMEISDFLILISFLITACAEFFNVKFQYYNFTLVVCFLLLKIAIYIYFIAREFRLYEVNKKLLWWLQIVMVIISIFIAVKFNNAREYLFLECLMTAEFGIVFSMALLRKTNKRSYELLVIGIMSSAFSIILMSNNLYDSQVGIEIAGRITHAAGLLMVTLGVLASSSLRQS